MPRARPTLNQGKPNGKKPSGKEANGKYSNGNAHGEPSGEASEEANVKANGKANGKANMKANMKANEKANEKANGKANGKSNNKYSNGKAHKESSGESSRNANGKANGKSIAETSEEEANGKKRKAETRPGTRKQRALSPDERYEALFGTPEARKPKGKRLPESERPDMDFSDLDPEDYDGHIRRCEYYIKRGHSRIVLTGKINGLKEAKEARNEIMQIYGDGEVDWDTAYRLRNLYLIAEKLIEDDPNRELVNVRAVIAAYKAKKIKFGTTSYWAQGKMLAESPRLDFKKFRELNTKENRGNSGFWVEGIHQSNTVKAMSRQYISNPSGYGTKQDYTSRLSFAIRLDQRLQLPPLAVKPYPQVQLTFLDDTGADVMTIYHDDLGLLMNEESGGFGMPHEHMMGYALLCVANGEQVIQPAIALQVNAQGEDHLGNECWMKDEWTSICAHVMDGNSAEIPGIGFLRLSGPYLRSMFWVGSAPRQPLVTHAADRRYGLHLPGVRDEDLPEEPIFGGPYQIPEWGYSEDTGRFEVVHAGERRHITPRKILKKRGILPRTDDDSSSSSDEEESETTSGGGDEQQTKTTGPMPDPYNSDDDRSEEDLVLWELSLDQ